VPVRRPLFVEDVSLIALGEEIDSLRRHLGTHHQVISISHAVAQNPDSPTGYVYSAVLLLELPD